MSLEPGIYKATVRGVPDQIVIVNDEGSSWTALPVKDCRSHNVHRDITDARPLIVLDAPKGAPSNHWSRLEHFLRNGGWDFTADQIEAQTKRPRIPEPGLWGVVAASCEHSDVRGSWLNDGLGWVRVGHERIKAANHDGWSDLIDPTLIRDGVS